MLHNIFHFLSSLKFAVCNVLLLAVSLATGTFLESYYDTKVAQYFVYQSAWFHFSLFLFAVNILCSALSRWPWRMRHLPFLVAHLGILMLLFGAFLTDRYGIDGQMKLSENQVSSTVEMGQEFLALEEKNEISKIIPVPFLPPEINFKPVQIPEYKLTIDQYLAHADPVFVFKEWKGEEKNEPAVFAPALQIKLTGGPMNLNQELWLWEGDAAWRELNLGPARFTLSKTVAKTALDKAPAPIFKPTPATAGIAQFDFIVDGNTRALRYESVSKRGEKREGKIDFQKVTGSAIETGWLNIKIQILNFYPRAMNDSTYAASRIQYGDQAPPAAIHLKSENSKNSDGMWLGLGDHALLETADKKAIGLAFLSKRVTVPFAMKLNRFEIQKYDGTDQPSSFQSNVSIIGGQGPENVVIKMNEPLNHNGFTLYQSSYVPEAPRPTTSIFSVNKDPGRRLKYSGSLLIVLGSILLFSRKYFEQRRNLKKKFNEKEATV